MPRAATTLAVDSGRESSRPEARAEAGDTFGRRAATVGKSLELPHRRWVGDLIAAGAEHASGLLRRPDDAQGSQAGPSPAGVPSVRTLPVAPGAQVAGEARILLGLGLDLHTGLLDQGLLGARFDRKTCF